MKHKHWTLAEDHALIALYADHSTELLAQYFSRPTRAVHNRVRKLGLRKSHAYVRTLNTQISRSRFAARPTATAAQSDCRTPRPNA